MRAFFWFELASVYLLNDALVKDCIFSHFSIWNFNNHTFTTFRVGLDTAAHVFFLFVKFKALELPKFFSLKLFVALTVFVDNSEKYQPMIYSSFCRLLFHYSGTNLFKISMHLMFIIISLVRPVRKCCLGRLAFLQTFSVLNAQDHSTLILTFSIVKFVYLFHMVPMTHRSSVGTKIGGKKL